MSIQDIPQDTMRCVLASAHGDDIDSHLYMRDDYPKPIRKEGEVLIKVCACALAPGDVRVLAGHCDYFQEPPNGFPYIPGGDISGVVVEADAKSRFNEGDAVIAEFELPRPLNGLAEFISVKERLVEMAPKRVPLAEASTLPSSAMAAMVAAKKYVKPDDRVLVLGGGGGVGNFFLQMAKANGAGYVVCTTTTDKEWLMPTLGVDKVVNYQETNWWEDEGVCGVSFDVIVDLAVGRDAWVKATEFNLLHRQGIFVAFTMDNPLAEAHNLHQALTSFLPMTMRMMRTKFSPCSPKYVCLGDWCDPKPGRLAEVVNFVDDGGMKIVLDPVSPLPFTEEGVKRGFHVMKKRHAHGKVVVKIQD